MSKANRLLAVRPDVLEARVLEVLVQAGASRVSAADATRALMHASMLGVDSHGVRLAEHYARMLAGGRINGRPVLSVERRGTSAAVIDADDGLGHHASYRAIEIGCALARESGVAAVGVRRSSHFGAAGAYALAAAEEGFVGFATTNADSAVALHEGRGPFHGTNPLAFAAPAEPDAPWLFDMATSSIPFNRVLLHRSLGRELPAGVAADASGRETSDAAEVTMLLPLGGTDYGYKGAGLAGIATVLAAVLTGATIDPEILAMYDPADTRTPRNVGHFFLVIDPRRFVGASAFRVAMAHYLRYLRASPARPGAIVLAPGDREWSILRDRRASGVPIDPGTARFLGLPQDPRPQPSGTSAQAGRAAPP